MMGNGVTTSLCSTLLTSFQHLLLCRKRSHLRRRRRTRKGSGLLRQERLTMGIVIVRKTVTVIKCFHQLTNCVQFW